MDYDSLAWFPLRVTYCRELKLKQFFDDLAAETFVPMHYEYIIVHGKRERRLQPMIHNLLFVKITRRQLAEIKRDASVPVRYIMHHDAQGLDEPLTIRDADMENFMRVARQATEDIRLVSTDSNMKIGDRVRVISGPFSGTEGVLARIPKTRSLRVVVTLQGVVSIATAEIPKNFLEKL